MAAVNLVIWASEPPLSGLIGLKITCEYQLNILANKKVSAAKEYGYNYIKFRLSPVFHL